MNSMTINIYGITIKMESDSDFVLHGLRKDFYFYLSDEMISKKTKFIYIKILKRFPPYELVPALEASLYDVGFIRYKNKHVHYVDYAGKGLMIYDFSKEEGVLYAEDDVFLWEKSKMIILSRIGEILDNAGLHRVHAVGLAKNNKALICLLPMGGGKTTTAINVLKNDPEIKLVADDVCFIDSQGFAFPFVLRIGARNKDLVSGIPSEYLEEINRPYYGIKYFIDPQYFQEQIAVKAKVRFIFVGKRVFQPGTEIKKIAKMQCIGPFIQSGVFGLGLPQLLEFFLRGNFLFALDRFRVVFLRSMLFLRLILSAQTFEITIGRDQEETSQKMRNFIDQHCCEGGGNV